MTRAWALLLAILAACRAPEIHVPTVRTDPALREAPMLAKQVGAGLLPPLSERLPPTPLVARHDYPGYESPGSYGGTPGTGSIRRHRWERGRWWAVTRR